jgi:hypothetical protein
VAGVAHAAMDLGDRQEGVYSEEDAHSGYGSGRIGLL